MKILAAAMVAALLAGCAMVPLEGPPEAPRIEVELTLRSPGGGPVPAAIEFGSGDQWLLEARYTNRGLDDTLVFPCDDPPLWTDPSGADRTLLGSCDQLDLAPQASRSVNWTYERLAVQQAWPEPRLRVVPLDGLHEFRLGTEATTHDVRHVPLSAVQHATNEGWTFSAWIVNGTWHGSYGNYANRTINSITDPGSCSGGHAIMVPTDENERMFSSWQGPCLGGYSPMPLPVANPGTQGLLSWPIENWELRDRQANATGIMMLLWPDVERPGFGFPAGYDDVQIHLQLRGANTGQSWRE